jgi:hypothetical protein
MGNISMVYRLEEDTECTLPWEAVDEITKTNLINIYNTMKTECEAFENDEKVEYTPSGLTATVHEEEYFNNLRYMASLRMILGYFGVTGLSEV